MSVSKIIRAPCLNGILVIANFTPNISLMWRFGMLTNAACVHSGNFCFNFKITMGAHQMAGGIQQLWNGYKEGCDNHSGRKGQLGSGIKYK